MMWSRAWLSLSCAVLAQKLHAAKRTWPGSSPSRLLSAVDRMLIFVRQHRAGGHHFLSATCPHKASSLFFLDTPTFVQPP